MISEYRLKTGKVGNAVVGACNAVEDTVVGGYKKAEDAFVGAFLKKSDDRSDEGRNLSEGA